MRNLFIIIYCLITSIGFGQVTCIDYQLEYNNETNQYDVSLLILGGSASTTFERSQYNSLLTVVVPTGLSLNITDKYMPLENNQFLTSNLPGDWYSPSQLNAPQANPTKDFYTITPNLSPVSFYNELNKGDVVQLFSFTIGESSEYNEEVRLFNNETDPSSLDPGMFGANFSNTFRIGNSPNIYTDSGVSCVTSIDEPLSLDANIYPNPFQRQIKLKLSEDIKNVYVLGLTGKVYYNLFDVLKKDLIINTTLFPTGVYFVIIETNSGAKFTTRAIKI